MDLPYLAKGIWRWWTKFEENKVLQEELMRIKARPALNSFGIWMLGPALLEYGTEEQKMQHIPKILKGN